MVGVFVAAIMAMLRLVVWVFFAVLNSLLSVLRWALVGLTWLLGRVVDGMAAVIGRVRAPVGR